MFWVRRSNLHKYFRPLGWTKSEIRTLHRRHTAFLSQWIADVARLEDATGENLAGKLIFEGEGHLREGLAKGKGVLLLNVHLGNWWYGRACLWLRGYRLVGVVNRVEILGVERFLDKLRAKLGMRSLRVATGGSQAAEEVFAGNGIFSVHFDVAMPLRWDHSNWYPLGAAMIHADVGPARLALRHEATVLLMTSVRTESGAYRVTITPMPVPEKLEPDQLHARWLEELNRLILHSPEQWWNWGAVWLRRNG
jgi:lauroyl/myristoyl acyltransferase